MKKIVVVNQAVNYLTIGIANELVKEYDLVALITGSIHVQGEELSKKIRISKINKYSDGNIISRSINWSFASIRIFFILLSQYRQYEILYITNPPIAYFASFLLPNKFSILMWDVYPDMLKVYNISNKNIFYRFWVFLNRSLFKRVFRIYSIGEQLKNMISNYVDEKKIYLCDLWTNFDGAELPLSSNNIFIKDNYLEDQFVIQYSGNIGATHNIGALIQLAEYLKRDKDILVQIIGRGNSKSYYENLVKEKGISNIQFLPFQSDEMFPFSLSAADVGVVVLDDRVSKGSVPSKTYNLMRAGKPILYIASQESELYIYAQKYNNGKCFNSNAITDISEFILKLKNDTKYYQLLSENSKNASSLFDRSNARKFVESYLGIHEK